jgi:hypothetical protein
MEENKKMSTADKTAVSGRKNTLSDQMTAAKKILNTTKEAGGTGVLAIYNHLGCFDGIKVNIPNLSAKYMNLVPKHTIGTPEADLNNVHNISLFEVPEHFRHGDIMRRLKDGSAKPAVIRHFFVPAEKCGQEVIAMVEVQKKVSLVNGEETIILNIHPSAREEATHELRLGTSPSGQGYEFPIPDQEKRVIAIRLIGQRIQPGKAVQTTSEANPCPAKRSGLEVAVYAKTISTTPAKTSVKKIVLGNGKKKFVLQH